MSNPEISEVQDVIYQYDLFVNDLVEEQDTENAKFQIITNDLNQSLGKVLCDDVVIDVNNISRDELLELAANAIRLAKEIRENS